MLGLLCVYSSQKVMNLGGGILQRNNKKSIRLFQDGLQRLQNLDWIVSALFIVL